MLRLRTLPPAPAVYACAQPRYRKGHRRCRLGRSSSRSPWLRRRRRVDHVRPSPGGVTLPGRERSLPSAADDGIFQGLEAQGDSGPLDDPVAPGVGVGA